MRLAVSNIAWEPAEEQRIAAVFDRYGVEGLEIAPTKVWPAPLEASAPEIAAYRAGWEDRGVKIVAMQALLFGRPELSIFGSPEIRQKTVDYLLGIMDLAAALGVNALVFGSPKNRLKGDLSDADARAQSTAVFRQLGIEASARGVALCVEPNPPQYGCDFVCTVQEGCDLVKAVGTPGFRLHLDVSSMTLNNEPYPEAIALGVPYAAHFHVSEPYLACVGSSGVPHDRVGAALKQSGYSGWISIEMKSGCSSDNVTAIEAAVRLVREHYA